MSDIERALAVFRGLSSGDPALATKNLDLERYVEHNPRARGGIEGTKQYIDQVAASRPDLKVIRAYQDGPYVVT